MGGTELESRIRSIARGEVLVDEPMSRHTSFRVGGPADILVTPRDTEDLVALLRALAELGVPCCVIGAGTNVLVRDEGIRGVVIKIADAMSAVSRERWDIVRAEAGALMPSLCRTVAQWGLSGLEFASGIPGTVGGAVAMNAAAYGSCVCEVVRAARVVTRDGSVLELSRDELAPGLKTTRVLEDALVLVQAAFQLRPDDPEAIRARMKTYLDERSRRQPLSLPSAGCIFKNPAGGGAGRLIDAVGLKGARIGGAEVSRVHANFIVNTGGATARDILSLMEKVQEAVRAKFGVTLEPEVRILGG